MYYEVKIRHTDPDTLKEKNEHYITDVELFAEAEQKGLELYAYRNIKCDVIAVSRSAIKEILNRKDADNPFYKATLTSVFYDIESDKVKEQKYYVLLSAKDMDEAYKTATEYLKQGYDMHLDAIVKSKIIAEI